MKSAAVRREATQQADEAAASLRRPQLIDNPLGGSHGDARGMNKSRRFAFLACALVTSAAVVGANDKWDDANKAISKLAPGAYPELPPPYGMHCTGVAVGSPKARGIPSHTM